jgi:hypothetical protein
MNWNETIQLDHPRAEAIAEQLYDDHPLWQEIVDLEVGVELVYYYPAERGSWDDPGCEAEAEFKLVWPSLLLWTDAEKRQVESQVLDDQYEELLRSYTRWMNEEYADWRASI